MKRCTSRMLTASSIVCRRQRLSHGCWQTRPGGCRQRIVEDHRFERVLETALLVELQEARNVHVQRATVLARRERQLVAHSCLAASRNNVIFELLAEVPHRGEHGVGRGLSQTAERAVANVAAQFVQQSPDAASRAEPLVMRFRMRSALLSPTRQGTHLPQDSELVNSTK